jgi:hypothetical protein
MNIHTSFIWTIIFSHGAFEYGVGSKFRGYVESNAEPLCVEFCTFMQYHAFVNYFVTINALILVIIICPSYRNNL